MTSNKERGNDNVDLAECAKAALERVCSGAGLDPASRYYGPAFVDHVNGLVLHGLEGGGPGESNPKASGERERGPESQVSRRRAWEPKLERKR